MAAIVALTMVAVACGHGEPVGPAGGAAPARPCKEAAGFTTDVQDRGSQPVSGATTAIDAGDFFFAPTCATGAAAGTITLTIHNTGQALHNVTVKDQNIDHDVQPGQTITVQLTVASAPVQYFCKYHRTSGMVGAVLPDGS